MSAAGESSSIHAAKPSISQSIAVGGPRAADFFGTQDKLTQSFVTAEVPSTPPPIPSRINTRVARSTSISYSAGASPSDHGFSGASSPRRRKGSNVTSADVARGIAGSPLRRRASVNGGVGRGRFSRGGIKACRYPLFLLGLIGLVVWLGKEVVERFGPRREPIRFRESDEARCQYG